MGENYSEHVPMLVDNEEDTGQSALVDDTNVYYPDNLDYLVNALELVTPKHGRNEGLAPIPDMDLPPSARESEYLRTDMAQFATHALPGASPAQRRPIDLSLISRSPLSIPRDLQEFELSLQLQHDLSVGRTRSNRRSRHTQAEVETLLRRVFEETEDYGRKRKEVVRETLKERQDEFAHDLSSSQKKQLRNRREAKVTREKDQAEESAVRSALKWMIANAEIRHPEDCTCRRQGMEAMHMP